MGLRVKTHINHSITWIDFYKAFVTLQWVHLPRHQIIWKNTRPAWVCRPNCGCVEISSGENIFLDAKYQSSELLFNILVEVYTDEKVLKKRKIIQKYLGPACSGGWQNIILENEYYPSQKIVFRLPSCN